MRIGFDAKRVFHNFRGLGSYGRTLLEGLDCFYPEFNYFLYTPPFDDPRSMDWSKRFPSLQVCTPTGRIEKKLPNLWRRFLLGKSLERDHLDIYHGLSHDLPYGIPAGKIKKVVTVHDLIFLRFPEFFPWLDRQIYLKKLRHSCEQADVILAICEQTKNDLMEFLSIREERIRVIYQGIHPRFYETLNEREISQVLESYGVNFPYILFVGAFEARKNPLGLIEAFCKVKDRIEHNLILIGEGKSYKKEMLELIQKEKVEDRVKIISSVPSEKLPIFYCGSSLFATPPTLRVLVFPLWRLFFAEVR